jgi:carbon monoxide dehydrogenase subunit G
VKVSGERRFDAARTVVWEVLNDPARMAKLMPGVESFDVQDERHWSAKVKVPLGMGGLPLSFSFEKTEEREPEYARLNAKGNGVGAIVKMDTQFHLSETAEGTEMQWEADVGIMGPVGAMGQRILQPIVNQQVGNVLTALEAQVMEAKGESDEPAGPLGHAHEESPGGAEEGIHPASPETYSEEPKGPTRSTNDEG